MLVLKQLLTTQVTQHPFNINSETIRWGPWGPGNQTHAHLKGVTASRPQTDPVGT